jgi:hypothetical protein
LAFEKKRTRKEGRLGVDARGGEHLEERLVLVVAGVVVARGAVAAGAEPRCARKSRELIACFHREDPCAVLVAAPASGLERAPEQGIRDAGSDVGRDERVPADGVHRQRLGVALADDEVAVVREERLPVVAVPEVEEPKVEGRCAGEALRRAWRPPCGRR